MTILLSKSQIVIIMFFNKLTLNLNLKIQPKVERLGILGSLVCVYFTFEGTATA